MATGTLVRCMRLFRADRRFGIVLQKKVVQSANCSCSPFRTTSRILSSLA
jgi:hypothetical protein